MLLCCSESPWQHKGGCCIISSGTKVEYTLRVVIFRTVHVKGPPLWPAGTEPVRASISRWRVFLVSSPPSPALPSCAHARISVTHSLCNCCGPPERPGEGEFWEMWCGLRAISKSCSRPVPLLRPYWKHMWCSHRISTSTSKCGSSLVRQPMVIMLTFYHVMSSKIHKNRSLF